MITVYKRRSNLVTLCGLVLFVLALCLCWLGDHFPVLPSRWVEAGYLTGIPISFVLVIFGVCYYAGAKGYSTAWGAVCLLFAGIGWLILLFLPDREKEAPDEPPEKIPFPQQAAKASLIAPLLSFIIVIFLQPQMRESRISLFILGSISALFIIGGFLLGIVALMMSERHEGEGIGGKAIPGTLINGLFLSAALLFIPKVMSGNWHMSPARHAIHTYNDDGVQFLYDNKWEVTEEPVSTNNAGMFHRSRSIAIERWDKTAGVWISFYPFNPGRTNPSLEDYARRLVFAATGSNNAPMVRITGKIGGVEQPGLRVMVTHQRKDGSSWSGEGDFFMLQNSKCQVIVDTLTGAGIAGRFAIRSILDSLKIEGMAGVNVRKSGDPASLNVKMIVYKPKGASAMIGNKTVMAGDALEGFKIIAIDKDSIIVQSPAGEKKVLRMGDDLK
jgi:hypothetical protein